MVDKEKKDDRDKEKEEKEKEKLRENEKNRSEINALLSDFNLKKTGIKLDEYVSFVQKILEKLNRKIKDQEIYELFSTALFKILQPGLSEKELANFPDKLDNDQKCDLMKAFYLGYDRIANKKDIFGIRPAKLINVHNKLISSEGQGGVARSIFSIQK